MANIRGSLSSCLIHSDSDGRTMPQTFKDSAEEILGNVYLLTTKTETKTELWRWETAAIQPVLS
ncbi:hypothetical protein RP20_CCG027155 [Aedes albopictus]|nr:hypothetical protein RP20_CCG027155 [Aedes albopictus]